MKKILIGFILLIVGCAVRPTLIPVNISYVDIQKDGKMFFELVDSHRKVIAKNRTNLAGIHHDVDENNFLPKPFVQYLKENIINNLKKSPGLEILNSKENAQFLISFDLQFFDVYRDTPGGSTAALLLGGALLGGALMEETCTAIIRGTVTVSDISNGEILCSFNTDITKSTEFRFNVFKPAYSEATEQATSELVKQIVLQITEC